MTRRKKTAVLFMSIGVLILAAAISLAVYNFCEEQRAEKAASEILSLLQQKIETVSQIEVSEEMPTIEIDGYEYIGYLTIPTLDLKLPVMAAWDYERLKIAPCLYYGSARKGNMVIAAHNYATHFGRLSKLNTGDSIKFIDVNGIVYNYAVDSIETLEATATEEMLSDRWNLTLYTCTYGGKNRVTVRCVTA